MSDDVESFRELLGLEFTDLEAGHSRCELAVRDALRNPHGVLHGGVLYAMADTGMGAALYPELRADQQCATVEVKINYLEPVEDGRVVCATTLERLGRSVAYLESTLEQDAEPVARATGSYAVFET